MKVGVNGAVRDISDLKVDVNGAVRTVSEAYIGVSGAVKKVWPKLPIGTQIIIDEVKSYADWWICPASGRWHIEGHGGGGSGAAKNYNTGYGGGGGGGSGEEYEATFNANEAISYFIGNCPGVYRNGQDTTFGNYTFAGGEASSGRNGGYASGSLATKGRSGGYNYAKGEGGVGNKNKPSQTYGNGGDGGGSKTATLPGSPGAIILTYLG